MRHLLHKIVTKKTERLRACLLLALLITAGGLALGGKETPPTPAAPAEASEPGALSGLIVALDPGHGGYDGGARAQDCLLYTSGPRPQPRREAQDGAGQDGAGRRRRACHL